MGRGGYLGGGTIIRPGLGWFSNDSHRGDQPPSGKSKLVATGRATAKAFAVRKKAAKPKIDEKVLWSNFVGAVIAAKLQNRPIPNPPKQIKDAVLQISEGAGGIENWVKQHPQYQTIFDRLEKKRRRGERIAQDPPRPKPDPTPQKFPKTQTRQATSGRSHPEIVALDRERDLLFQRLTAAQEMVRSIEGQIKDVEGRIRFASRLLEPSTS